MEVSPADAVLPFFAKQRVLLTGATGGLGGCILFKLALIVKAAKIYAIVRQDPAAARKKWRDHMGNKADEIMATGRVVLLQGDTTEPRLGLSTYDYLEIQKEVTVVINASANINFRDPLQDLIATNCFSALELAVLGSGMMNLVSFVHISTAYASSFLGDGPVEEKVYEVGQPEEEIQQLFRGEALTRGRDYPWPYAYSKHLAEQLLTQRFPRLPLLIVRPTSIGPAVQEPFPQYMPRKSCPLSNLYARLMMSTEPVHTWYVAGGRGSGANTLDEVPVDTVANMSLQHVYRGTRGVVHAASPLYIPRTLNDYLEEAARYAPEEWRARMTKHVYTSDRSQGQGKVASFYNMLTRDWQFSTARSRGLDTTGPLGITLDGHDAEAYVRERVGRVVEEVRRGATKAKPMPHIERGAKL